jgi:hypothetical protein
LLNDDTSFDYEVEPTNDETKLGSNITAFVSFDFCDVNGKKKSVNARMVEQGWSTGAKEQGKCHSTKNTFNVEKLWIFR